MNKNKNAPIFIALRYLWGRAHEGGRYLRGAAAGIAVSLIPIIITLIVADGMIRGIIDRYLELGTGHLQVFNYTVQIDEDDIEKIKELDGINGVWLEQRGTGVIAGKGGRTGVTVRSIEASFWEDQRSAGFLKIIDGASKPETASDIVLGETLASNIGVQVGDTVRLMTVRTEEDGIPFPRSASFTVRGVLSCGYNELDALWCIINTEGGKRVLSYDSNASSLIVKIDDPYKNSEDFFRKIYVQMGNGYTVFTWKDLLSSQYNSYEFTRQILLFIMALVVIVAAVNVSSATSMLSLERQKDIAILKVSGAGINGITGIFIWGGFLTGLFGSVIGLSIGLLMGANINFLIRSLEKLLTFFSLLFNGSEIKILDPGFYLETIPIIINWNDVLLIWIFTIVCSVLSSWLPARRAGKLKPMEILRKT